MNIILLMAYMKKSWASSGAFQKLARGIAPPIITKVITSESARWRIKDAVRILFFSSPSALTRCVIKGLRINPTRIISRMAATLVKRTQIPMSAFDIIRAMKNTFRNPKNTMDILSRSEYAPWANILEFGELAKSLNDLRL